MQLPRTILIACTLLLCSQNAGFAQQDSSSAKNEPTSAPVATIAKAVKPKEDLPNFHEVYPFLYRSGEPTQVGLKKLKEMGITTLIDLRAPSERAFDEEKAAKELDMKYIMLTMTSAPPTAKQVDTFMSTIEKAKTSNHKVLVHCAHGSDRTGCMVGIWRVVQDNWTYDEAYKEMRKYWFTPKFTRLADAVKQREKIQTEIPAK